MKNIIFLVILLNISCNKNIENKSSKNELILKNSRQVEYFPNGNIKSIIGDTSSYYYEKFKNVLRFKNIDLANGRIKHINYDSTGLKTSEGIITRDGMTIGRWDFFKKNGALYSISHYKIINGEPYLNQDIYLNEKKDTLVKGSHFFTVHGVSDDTITLGQTYQMYLELQIPLYKGRGSETCVLLGSKEGFNHDYSNEHLIKKDTFYNLTKDVINQKWFEDAKFENIVVFAETSPTPGNKVLRGILIEYYKNDDNQTEFNKKYFEKHYYIKDTI